MKWREGCREVEGGGGGVQRSGVVFNGRRFQWFMDWKS